MDITPHNKFEDVKIIKSSKIQDQRGYFLKNFNKELNEIIKFQIDEVYYSKNIQNVIRGIHYQRKKSELTKIIKCVDGEILDFFIDLRKMSPTYGQFDSIIICEIPNILNICFSLSFFEYLRSVLTHFLTLSPSTNIEFFIIFFNFFER